MKVTKGKPKKPKCPAGQVAIWVTENAAGKMLYGEWKCVPSKNKSWASGDDSASKVSPR